MKLALGNVTNIVNITVLRINAKFLREALAKDIIFVAINTVQMPKYMKQKSRKKKPELMVFYIYMCRVPVLS
jgi:hypothetical protein